MFYNSTKNLKQKYFLFHIISLLRRNCVISDIDISVKKFFILIIIELFQKKFYILFKKNFLF